MTTPSKEQLDRYMDLVVEGHSPEDAMEVVFPKPKKPTVMVTEFPDGVVIGWDHCTAANGGCGKSVAKCECKGGPKELKVFEQWRDGSKTMPDYAAAAKQAKAAGVTGKIAGTDPGVVVATQDRNEAARALAGIVTCVLSNHDTPKDQADQNDDKTWSCHACQEAGIQRQRADG